MDQARELFDERIVRLMYNLCPGCGEDNMPLAFDWLVVKALRICPKCGRDRTPSGYDD